MKNSNSELTVIEQKEIEFQGDTILSMKTDRGIMVAVAPISDNLGIDPNNQRVKLKNHPTFTTCDLTCRGSDGKNRTFMCLSIDDVYGWLMTIHPDKVRPDLRDKLIRYQRECIDVLKSYWIDGEALNPRKYAPNTIKEGEPARPLTVVEQMWFNFDKLTEMRKTETNPTLIHLAEHALLQSFVNSYHINLGEPVEGEIPILIPERFVLLVNKYGWPKDLFMIWFPNQIKNTQDFHSWCKACGVRPRKCEPLDYIKARETTKKIMWQDTHWTELVKQYKVNYGVIRTAYNKHKGNMDQLFFINQDHNARWYIKNSRDYADYSQNNQCMKIKRNVFRSTFDCCSVCGADNLAYNQMNVHHRDYMRIGIERVEDLMPVCVSCHTKMHQDPAFNQLQEQLIQEAISQMYYEHNQVRPPVTNNRKAPLAPHLQAIK